VQRRRTLGLNRGQAAAAKERWPESHGGIRVPRLGRTEEATEIKSARRCYRAGQDGANPHLADARMSRWWPGKIGEAAWAMGACACGCVKMREGEGNE
jgi:hypothetical protein